MVKDIGILYNQSWLKAILPNLGWCVLSNKLSKFLSHCITSPCNRPRCQLCPLLNIDYITFGLNNVYKIQGSFTTNFTNLVYAIICLQCPSTIYILSAKDFFFLFCLMSYTVPKYPSWMRGIICLQSFVKYQNLRICIISFMLSM